MMRAVPAVVRWFSEGLYQWRVERRWLMPRSRLNRDVCSRLASPMQLEATEGR